MNEKRELLKGFNSLILVETLLSLMKSAEHSEKKGSKKPDLEALIHTLTADVEAAHGQKWVELLHKALIGFGLDKGENQDGPLEENERSQSLLYGSFFNQEAHQKLLPVCQLALMSEQNGRAEDHALCLDRSKSTALHR